MGKKEYCVYIMTNSRHTVLYTGVTNGLRRRVDEHKNKTGSVFTKKYNVNKLVFYECADYINTPSPAKNKSKQAPEKRKLI